MPLAHVAGPAGGASRAARGAERDRILTGQHARSLQTLLRDDVAREYFVVFAQQRTHIGDELLDLAHEFGMDVGLHAADGVVGLYQAASRGLLQDVKHLLTVAEPVEERRQSPHVHTETREEQQVRINALQLVHDRADILHPLRHLDAQPLLDAHAERMAVLRGPQIIQPVRKGQRLGIGQPLAQLLDAAVDITAVHVELLDDLALQRHPEAQHTVRRRVLGTDVDDVFVLFEEHVALADETAVGGQLETRSAVLRHLVGHAQRIERRIVIFAQRIPHPVVAQEQPPHVGMVQKPDAEIVEHLAFVQLGGLPQIADRGQAAFLAARRQRPQDDVFARGGGFEVIDGSEALFAPVHARQTAQEIESLGPEPGGQIVKLLRGHGPHAVARLGPYGLRFPCRYLVFQRHTHCFSPPSTFKSFRSEVRSRRSSSSYSSRPICLFTPPKKRCSFTLRCSCIRP